MKIHSPNISFNGVILIGSVPQNKKDSFDKLVANQKLAKTVANSLDEKNEDTFVIDISTKDARGNATDRVNTYVLTGKEARLINKFNDIKIQLQKMFAKNLQSDAFVHSLNRKIDSISKEQLNTAQFIAENKLYENKVTYEF